MKEFGRKKIRGIQLGFQEEEGVALDGVVSDARRGDFWIKNPR